MKLLIQRVKCGSVTIDGKIHGEIGAGYVVLLGVRTGDSVTDVQKLVKKTIGLRIFEDDSKKMNRSIVDIGGEVLVVSQFTLYADTRKGNRPSFIRSGDPELANQLYQEYISYLRNELGSNKVKTGVFGATMEVKIINDGPVTIELTTD